MAGQIWSFANWPFCSLSLTLTPVGIPKFGVSYILCSQWLNNVKALFFHPSPFFLSAIIAPLDHRISKHAVYW